VIDDGNAHKFRTCYNDYHKNEINFFFFFFGIPRKPGGLLGEIFTIRIYRALHEFKKIQIEKYNISKSHVEDAIIRYIFVLGLHFSIPQKKLENLVKEQASFAQRLRYLYDYEDLSKEYEIEKSIVNIYEEEIFLDIISSIIQYFNLLEKIEYFKSNEIIQPPMDYTIQMPNNGFRIDINEDNITAEDFDNITYTLL